METITNAATSVTSTVSNLIYGQPAKENETAHNETGGSEPLSGAQGKGTASEPFDQGNAETPVNTSSATTTTATAAGNTSYKEDDFLKLNPTLGKPTTTEPSTGTTGTTTGETSMPIVPLNPDAATSSSTGNTDKAGVTDKLWKPTELDEVKPSGAPGAGPSAPEYKVATPDTSLASTTSEKPAEHHHSEDASKDDTTASAAKKTDGVETSHSDTAKAQPSVGGPIEEVLNQGTSTKAEHTVDESEAKDPHSKMADKTVRATNAHKTGESSGVESHAAETSSHPSESSEPKAAEPTSPSGGDEKSEKKMSQLKDKLKNKLHIGSKDK